MSDSAIFVQVWKTVSGKVILQRSSHDAAQEGQPFRYFADRGEIVEVEIAA